MKNKFLKHPSTFNNNLNKKQRNYIVSLVRAAKKKFFSELDINKITNVKTFWKTVKPSFTEKMKDPQNIKIISDEQIITDKHNLVDLFNDYFSSITAELGIITHFTRFEPHRRYNLSGHS